MRVGVINSGSSSLKFKLFEDDVVQYSCIVEHIGEDGSEVANHLEALQKIEVDFTTLDVVGHRVVHGGEFFTQSVEVDEDVMQKIASLSRLAPLHNPANLEGIEVVKKIAPSLKQVAVFDTAFHSSMPQEAYLYAIDTKFYKQHHIRRYGFHGTSHSYLAKEAAKILNKELNELNIISLHLGNGASACAIKNGKSVDTSMGFTPLEGLVMGTRSGDLDPAIVLYMQQELGMSVDEVQKELNKHSGLLGLAKSNDVRDLQQSQTKEAQVALDIFVRRVQKYIGSYIVLLDDVDAIVFSGGIGEHSEYIRNKILDAKVLKDIKSLVIQTDEELEIAQECVKVLQA